ncbi:MAG TPA: AMP-binding protein, partial [Steroidobacteraceae bacterium]
MDRFWIKQYPPVTPAEIDPSEYSSLKALIDASCEQFATHTAFIQMEQHLSYEELDRLSNRFAAWLQRIGLKKGDRVAIMLPNILQYPVVMFGVLRAGMTVVNTNPLYTAPELEHQLRDS